MIEGALNRFSNFPNMKRLVVVLLVAFGAVTFCTAEDNATDSSPFWTRSGLFEGDIMIPESVSSRSGLRDTRYRWSNRTIPYRLRAGAFNTNQANTISSALKQFSQTCVSVRPATASDKDFVLVTRDETGCWSPVGRQGGQQQLNLQDSAKGSCMNAGTIVHEFLHAFGFYHQQSASDRDNFVTIRWENVQEKKEHNFNKYGTEVVTDFGVGYDTQSIMHYDRYVFSKNGQPTMVSKSNQNQQLGNNRAMTDKDKRKLNLMYGCKAN